MNQEQLFASSRRWMQAAFEAFATSETSHDFAVHHAAVALEHLLKSYLASRHPALIVEGRDFNSLLHATGHGQYANVPLTRIKTIGLEEAYSRVARFLRPSLTVDNRTLAPVLAARGGVAHSGIYSHSEVHATLATCARLAEPVLEALGEVAANSYWGHFHEFRQQLIEEHFDSLRVGYEAKLARASREVARRFTHASEQEIAKTKDILGAKRLSPGLGNHVDEHEVPYECPACEAYGWLHGALSIKCPEGWFDVDNAVVVLDALSFDCPICGLRLGSDELKFAGFPLENLVGNLAPDLFHLTESVPAFDDQGNLIG